MITVKSLTVNFIVATTCCAETLLWLSFDMNLEAVLIVWIFCSADLRVRVKKICGFKLLQQHVLRLSVSYYKYDTSLRTWMESAVSLLRQNFNCEGLNLFLMSFSYC